MEDGGIKLRRLRRPRMVKPWEIGLLEMARGNDQKYPVIIDRGQVQEWSPENYIWKDIRPANGADEWDFPTVDRIQVAPLIPHEHTGEYIWAKGRNIILRWLVDCPEGSAKWETKKLALTFAAEIRRFNFTEARANFQKLGNRIHEKK